MSKIRKSTFLLLAFGWAGCADDAATDTTRALAVMQGANVAHINEATRSALDRGTFLGRLDLERQVGELSPMFAPRTLDGRFELGVPGGVRAVVEGSRVALKVSETHTFDVRVEAWGRATTLTPVPAAADVSLAGAEVRIARGDVVEWWRSLPAGLEHGVEIHRRPHGEGELVVTMALEGDLSPEATSHGAVGLVDAHGVTRGEYGHVLALDAEGTRLPARLDVVNGRVHAMVDDTQAVYPILIDPLVSTEEQVLAMPGTSTFDKAGSSVALDMAGTRLAVGQESDNLVHIFVRTGATWGHEQTLSGPRYFGASVSLSSDGTRLLVGAKFADGTSNAQGEAQVFLRTGTTWALETTLPNPDPGASDNFGESVALSEDGTVALIGAPGDDVSGQQDQGSAHVYTRANAQWTPRGSLSANGLGAGDRFGRSVALSSDGSIALVGAPGDNGAAGSGYVFRRTGDAWGNDGVVAIEPGGGEQCGRALSISGDGTVAAIGCPIAAGERGFIRMARFEGGSWSPEEVLRFPGEGPGDEAGAAVALSRDGTFLLAGAPTADLLDLSAGMARFFRHNDAGWVHQGQLVASGHDRIDQLGFAVAISGDGTRSATSAAQDETSGGDYAGTVRIHTLALVGAPDGQACTESSGCLNGFCVDGVCCNTPCGDGAMDCQACSVAEGAAVDGTCGPLAAELAAQRVCRPATGDCDFPEVCAPDTTECPADTMMPADTVCRTPVAGCDAPELCNGQDNYCPFDQKQPAGFVCRPAVHPTCDVEEVCDGISEFCPNNVWNDDGLACDDGDVCNGSADKCDLGACVATGAALDCDDDNVCTADFCDASGGCGSEPIEGCCQQASDCGDGNACTTDACENNQCVNTEIANCDNPTEPGATAGDEDEGCGCRTVGAAPRSGGWTLVGLLAAVWLVRRGRR